MPVDFQVADKFGPKRGSLRIKFEILHALKFLLLKSELHPSQCITH
jgi:hypothetical protein